MQYRFAPFSSVWNNGIFNVPNDIADKYLKMASGYQFKALIYILRHSGVADSSSIAKALGQDRQEVEDALGFWVAEGVLVSGDQAQQPNESAAAQQPEPAAGSEFTAPKKQKPAKELLSPPRLAAKDIVAIARDDRNIEFLLSDAQRVLGRTISPAEQEMLVNMARYYGLKVEVILMILEFYRSEKEKGRSIGISYVNAMAKNWSDEGIDSIAAAEEKLADIERSDRRWKEVVEITGIRHRRPTEKQRAMVDEWFADFDTGMITIAADIMKENTAQPSLAYVNKILKQWKKKGISSPAQVKAEHEAFEKKKAGKKSSRLESAPSYDLDKVMSDAMNNTEIK